MWVRGSGDFGWILDTASGKITAIPRVVGIDASYTHALGQKTPAGHLALGMRQRWAGSSVGCARASLPCWTGCQAPVPLVPISSSLSHLETGEVTLGALGRKDARSGPKTGGCSFRHQGNTADSCGLVLDFRSVAICRGNLADVGGGREAVVCSQGLGRTRTCAGLLCLRGEEGENRGS